MEKNKTISQEELEQWIQRAEGGDCEMLYLLGEYYYTGTKKDYRRALAYYLQAAEAGHILAQRRAGEMYMVGKKIGKNMNEATKWSTLAAEQGDIVAHYQLGKCYWEGKKQDKNRAFDHYFLAAKAGYAPAQQSIGEIIHSKGIDSKRLAEALKWVDSAAEQGNAEMQFQLGELYRTGNKKDTTRALKYHKMAAEAGHESAQLELGRMYLYVKEVINYNEAIKWLTLSAEQGNAWAQLDLGRLYQYNKKVRNFDEAIKNAVRNEFSLLIGGKTAEYSGSEASTIVSDTKLYAARKKQSTKRKLREVLEVAFHEESVVSEQGTISKENVDLLLKAEDIDPRLASVYATDTLKNLLKIKELNQRVLRREPEIPKGSSKAYAETVRDNSVEIIRIAEDKKKLISLEMEKDLGTSRKPVEEITADIEKLKTRIVAREERIQVNNSRLQYKGPVQDIDSYIKGTIFKEKNA